MAATFKTLLALDAKLVKAGHHPLTPWWREHLELFYNHPTAKTLVGRVGRGGAKSYTSVRVALNELLNGDWLIPPGEIHYWAVVSENKTEAGERLRLFAASLTALGVPHEPRGDTIVVPSLRRGLVVRASEIGAVSGFRCFGFSGDELSKWSNSDHSANPAQEVVASLDSMTVTHLGARSLLISSPLSTLDFHFKIFEQGDSEHQVTCTAPSWVANPSVTRESCLAKSRGDVRIFEREFGAVVQASVQQAFDPTDLEACICHGTRVRPYDPSIQYLVTYDCGGVSTSGKSETAIVAAHYEYRQRSPGEPVIECLVVDKVQVLRRSFLKSVKFESVVSAIVETCREYHCTRTIGDIHLLGALKPTLAQSGVTVDQAEMTLSVQAKRSSTLCAMVASGAIDLLDQDDLIKQTRGAALRARGDTFVLTAGASGMRDDVLDCLLLAVERKSIVKISGNAGVRKKPGRFQWADGKLVGSTASKYYRLGPKGEYIPCATPRDAIEFKSQQLERWRQGTTTRQDVDEYGDSLDDVIEQTLREASEAAAAEFELIELPEEFPLSPDIEAVDRSLNRNVR